MMDAKDIFPDYAPISMDNECPACGKEWTGKFEYGCEDCRTAYPDALLKAAGDEFDYMLQLRNGTAIRFMSAKFTGGEFVHLRRSYAGDHGPCVEDDLGYPCPRGIDVRISEIAWVADAPEGS